MNPRRDAAAASPAALALLAALCLGACGDDPVDPDPACAEAAPLAFAVSRDSVLQPGLDPVLDGAAIHYWAVVPPIAGRLTVEMTAEIPTNVGARGVDPFLYLWPDELGDPIAQGFDSTGEGPLLRVARLASEVGAGCYRIGASGWRDYDRGAYTIRAEFEPDP